jgi:heme exporter protein C
MSVDQRFVEAGRMLGLLALAGVALWLAMVVFVAPPERAQGVVQKIVYAHVPSWVGAYLGFVLTAAGGLGYLLTRRESFDRLALSGAEVGVFFCTLGMVTGPIWAKSVWGVWWVWDLRLTSSLILWFVYVAYLFLRAFAAGSDAARTFASVYGIAGVALIPFVYYAVDIAQGSSLHPTNPAREGLPPTMGWTLLAGFLAYLLLFAYFLACRLEIARLESALVDEGEGGSRWAT